MSSGVCSWEPLDAFNKSSPQPNKNALIVLNQPINSFNKFTHLWQNAAVRVCVDGGLDRLLDWIKTHENDQISQTLVPDYICGDLDSVNEATKKLFEEKGAKSIRLYNQDATDFQKTLKFIIELCLVEMPVLKGAPPDQLIENKFASIENIYCFCEFGGRLDHSLANLSSLYEASLSTDKRSFNAFMIGHESMTFLLHVGINIVYVDNEEALGKYCGIFPLGKPAVVTTRGLKWNLNRQLLEFGRFVSSSNEFCPTYYQNMLANGSDETIAAGIDDVFKDLEYDKKRRHVLIKTDQPVIWTMSIQM